MDEDEYKQKRKKNNDSVKKCRENEKKKMEMATEKLEEFKKENKKLEETLSSKQKELSVLKSLFMQSSGVGKSTASASTSNDIPETVNLADTKEIDETCINKKQKVTDENITHNGSDFLLDPFELDIIPQNFEFKPSSDNPFLEEH